MTEAAAVAKRRKKADVVELWQQRLTMTDRGFAASTGNIALILQNDAAWRGRLRYDARSNVIVVETGTPISAPSAARPYRDSDDARIAMWLEQSQYAIRLAPNSAHLNGAVNVTAEADTFDPVCDWLTRLVWDGVPRNVGWLAGYLGAANTELNSAYGLCWLISGVARALIPGAQADHVLALVGPQGRGKSSALRTVARRPEWFTDSLPSLSDKKAAGEVLLGRWIVEHSELDAVGRADLATAKAWLTAREDRYRAAYAKRAESHARRCVFAASTNEDTFLRDATGNRRFWPVSVGKINLDALERDADQLWAEAVLRYRQGEPWHLIDPKLIGAAIETQEAAYQADAWEPLIEDFLSRCAARVSIGDVLKGAVGLDPERWDQAAQNRVARCLARLGWTRAQRRDGRGSARRWAYERRRP